MAEESTAVGVVRALVEKVRKECSLLESTGKGIAALGYEREWKMMVSRTAALPHSHSG